MSASDRQKLEEIAAGWATVHELDPFLNRREKNLFLILDYDFPEKKLTRESAREILVKQNPMFKNVKVTRLFTGRPQGLVFGVRDSETADKVAKNRFVNFGPFRPIATRYSPIAMCMRCCAYTHATKECPAGFVACARCGSDRHHIDECPKKITRCLYCAVRGDDSNHPATSLACPYRRDLMEALALSD